MPKAVSEDTQRILMARRAALSSITTHPNWPELEAEVERKSKRIEKVVLAKTLGGMGSIPDEELIYLRGFLHGIRWFVTVPGAAERTLERFLQEQGLRVQAEEEDG